ncbi:MAG TPA: hypothetical protein DCQ58_06615 [Saprospirales bacterium]|nr:hypothetical protein [Saprospirales bacterium]
MEFLPANFVYHNPSPPAPRYSLTGDLSMIYSTIIYSSCLLADTKKRVRKKYPLINQTDILYYWSKLNFHFF